MQRDYLPSWHHHQIANALEQVERGELKKLMIFVPPRHGKSELASIKFPAWYLGRNPKKEIIAASYTAELAEDFGRKVRNLLADPYYRPLFNTTLSPDSSARNRWHTTEGGSYIAAGVGGSITGHGADVLLIDDPIKSREEANSLVYRQKVWEWFTSTAYTRLHPNGAIIVILTRWHEDDLAGRLLAQEDKDWKIINLPAIAEQDEENRKAGEAIWPERYSLDKLLDIKRVIGTDEFNCLYQQNPFNVESQEFKRAWFKSFRDDDCPTSLNVFTTVDLAISMKNSADDSCIMSVGVAPDNSKYVLEYVYGKLNPSQVIEEIFRQNEIYKPLIVGIETVAYQEALAHFLKIKMRERNQFMRIHEIHTRQDKQTKIRGLIPYYENGNIYHRSGHCTELEEQLLMFPKGRKDDLCDTLAMQQELWNAPTFTKYVQKRDGKTLRQLIKEENMFAKI